MNFKLPTLISSKITPSTEERKRRSGVRMRKEFHLGFTLYIGDNFGDSKGTV